MKITVFDTETTGFFPKDFKSLDECPYVVQFGSITYDTETNQIISSINEIIKLAENIEIPQKTIEIHHITKEISNEKGVDIRDILCKFNEQLKMSDVLIAHNIEYDINIINYECRRYDIPFEYYNMKENSAFCTMRSGTNVCKIPKVNARGKYFKWPTLEELHKHLFGVDLQNLHDAYNDLIVCLRCYMYMNFKIDITHKNEDINTTLSSLIKVDPSSDVMTS